MITRFFRWLFMLCDHRWETVKMGKISAKTWGMYDKWHEVGERATMKCTKCGDYKVKDLW